jgi:hypothetical protein
MESTVFLITSLALFVVWSVIFFFFKRTRKEQMVMSLAGLLLSPAVMLFALTDYRRSLAIGNGVIAVEDFLFAFCLTGIAAVIYEAVVGKRLVAWRGERVLLRPKVVHWMAQLVIVFAIWTCISVSIMALFPINAVYAFAAGGMLIGTYIIADRHDLMLNALGSGALTALLLFILEQIFFRRLFSFDAEQIWQMENLSGVLLGPMPMEELLWFGVVGFAVGPLYEFVRHKQLR